MIFFLNVVFLLTSNHVLLADKKVRIQEGTNDECITPDGNPGKCLTLEDCPALLKYQKKSINDTETAEFLRKLKCTTHAGVCCKTKIENNENHRGVDPKCGRSSVTQINKVVNGQPADLGAWPWIAALGYTPINSRNREIAWRCGGSLINKRYVLTAAHCVRMPPQLPVKLSIVRLGEHDLTNNTEGANPVDYEVEKTIVHEGYKPQTNDIALVKLEKDVIYSDRIRPICLPTAEALRSSNYERKFPFLVGWGETIFNGPSSEVLLQIQVPIVDNTSCGKAYAALATITSNQLCAGDGKKDSCRGDSGGPLMLPQSGVYYQIGIISFGYGCAEPGYPGVYTKVSSYIDWISTKTNNLL